MTYTEIIRQSRKQSQDISSLIHIYGEETYLIHHTVDQLKKNLVDESLQDFNCSIFESDDFRNIIDAIEMLPIMADKKLVVVKNIGVFSTKYSHSKEFANAISHLPGSVCLVIQEGPPDKRSSVYKSFTKAGGVAVECKFQARSDLTAWLQRILKSRQATMSTADVNYFLDVCGVSMQTLKNELDKLLDLGYSAITRQIIDDVTVKSFQTPTYFLTNALSEKKRAVVFERLSELKRNREEPIKMLHIISGHFLSLLKAKILLEDGKNILEVARMLKIGHDFVAKKLVEQSQRCNIDYLKNAVFHCQSTDFAVKNGLAEPWVAVEMLCMDILE